MYGRADGIIHQRALAGGAILGVSRAAIFVVANRWYAQRSGLKHNNWRRFFSNGCIRISTHAPCAVCTNEDLGRLFLVVYLPSFMKLRTLWLQASTLHSEHVTPLDRVLHRQLHTAGAGVQPAATASERLLSAADAHADCCVLPPAHRFQIFERREERVTGFSFLTCCHFVWPGKVF